MPTVTSTTESTTTVEAVVKVARKAVEIGEAGKALADELAALRMTRADIEKREKAVRDTLVGMLGEAEAGTVGGVLRVEVSPRTRKGVDMEKLAKIAPEIHALVETEVEYTVVVLR